MTRDEAKFILSAYRANGSDRDESVFAEALALVQKDAELAAWFAREQQLDVELAHKLREVTAPGGLREAILAGLRAGSGNAAPVRRHVGWGAGVALAAAAAAVALVFFVRTPKDKPVSAPPPVRPQLQGLETFAVNDALMAGGPHHGEWGTIAMDLHRQLRDPAVRLRSDIAVDFDGLCATGARKQTFDGHEIVEVCFMRQDTKLWYHLYVLRRSDFPSMGSPEKPSESGTKDGVGYLYWHDAKNHYIVVGPGDTELEKHLF